MKIVTILGARPQFIKASALSREILNRNIDGTNIEEIIIHTGQHYDGNMSDVFFTEMHIPTPKYFLGIGGNSHGAMTGQMIEKIENILLSELPDWVVVYGDTNSTLAGAIAASKLNLKIAHIESGLRSFNMKMPEEINRVVTDRISTLLFCPTQSAIDNLAKEGIVSWKSNSKAILSGDVMKDSAFFYKKFAKKPLNLSHDQNFVLCTLHRAENTDDPIRLACILSALNTIALSTQIIFPLHPRTKKIIDSGNYDISNLTILDPLGYLEMLWLIDNCGIVMTDSGGLQKEAYFFNKSCIVLRDETEWIELVNDGINILAGADKIKILQSFEMRQTLDKKLLNSLLFGDGNSSSLIIEELLQNC